MKRPEYVAAVVTACRRALAGEPYDQETLRAVFSRSGFTDGYLTGRRDGDMFGYRTREDVAGAEKVLGSLAALYRNETPRVKVSMAFALDPAGALPDGVGRGTDGQDLGTGPGDGGKPASGRQGGGAEPWKDRRDAIFCRERIQQNRSGAGPCRSRP